MTTSYSLLFAKNPATDLLVTLVGIDPFDDRIVDAFVRSVDREPTKKKLLEKVKADGRNDKKRGSFTFGKDEAFITLIIRDFTDKFDAKKDGFFKPTYFCCASQDEKESEYWYINYRIPFHYRATLVPFATWLPYKVGERVAELKERLKERLRGKKTDDFSERIHEVAPGMMVALAKRLQEIRAERAGEWADAELAPTDKANPEADHKYGEHCKVVSMEGFLKKRQVTEASPA